MIEAQRPTWDRQALATSGIAALYTELPADIEVEKFIANSAAKLTSEQIMQEGVGVALKAQMLRQLSSDPKVLEQVRKDALMEARKILEDKGVPKSDSRMMDINFQLAECLKPIETSPWGLGSWISIF